MSIGLPVLDEIDDAQLLSKGMDCANPLLAALANREEANRSGKVMTIVFIRMMNLKGQEISGYIDLAQRLKSNSLIGR